MGERSDRMVVGRDRGGAKPASQLASFPSMEFVSEAMALNHSYGDGADGGLAVVVG